jgi:RNA polymerase sigma-32 factor
VKRSKRLSREEEIALFKAGKSGDIVVAHLPLVHGMAHRYAKGRRTLQEDLVQEGSIGLMIAATKWNPDSGNRFVTYAKHWVHRMIFDHLRGVRRLVIAPNSAAVVRATAAMSLGTIRSPEALALAANVTALVADSVWLLLAAPEVPLERRTSEGGDLEWLAGESNPEAEVSHAYDAAALHIAIVAAIQRLTPQERRVVELRWLGDDVRSVGDVGQEMGIARQRVDILDKKARSKLAGMLKQVA